MPVIPWVICKLYCRLNSYIKSIKRIGDLGAGHAIGYMQIVLPIHCSFKYIKRKEDLAPRIGSVMQIIMPMEDR